MRLNQASDFALRILMLLAKEDQPLTVQNIAEKLNLVNSHTMKIVAKLVKVEILTSNRGRHGGISLALPPEDIHVGEIIRVIENDFAVVECIQTDKKTGKQACIFLPHCKLKILMHEARSAFLTVLDKQTLATLLH